MPHPQKIICVFMTARTADDISHPQCIKLKKFYLIFNLSMYHIDTVPPISYNNIKDFNQKQEDLFILSAFRQRKGFNMKKYYCPYCGEPTRRWYHKLDSRATNIAADLQMHCTSCNRKIPLKRPFASWIVSFSLTICLFCLTLYLIATGRVIYGCLTFALYVISHLAEIILAIIFRKFVKYDDDAKNDKYYKCSVELMEHVKHPKLYFYGTSVVLLLFEKKAVPVPVRIEPLEMNDRSCKCKIAFVLEKPTEEFAGKAFTLIDNDKTVGKGHFES